MAARRGRAPAKNETAAGLINALKFLGVLKAPTTTSIPQAHYAWLNMGQAIGFDGIVAAGHPIEEGIAGYPHAKLLLEALDNTDKNFTLTVRENGAFEIQSGKYSALVPSYDPSQVIPTQPDMNQGGFSDGAAFIKAMEAVGRVAVESGDVALYSAIRLTGDGSAMATDGNTIVEARHGNATPPVIVPKQFVTALLKADKTPVGIGINHDWTTLTIWFADNSWLRTAVYPSETWPDEVIETYYKLITTHNELSDVPAKLWSTAKALLPFTADNKRLIIRPGLIRTHVDRRVGAALEVADIAVSLDIDAKRLLAVEPLTKGFTIGDYGGGSTFIFYGDNVRGVIAGMAPQPEPDVPTGGGWGDEAAAATEAPQGGWTTTASAPASDGDGGWAMAAPAGSPAGASVPQGWNGIPANGLAGDPEYESERQGIPPEQVPVVDDAFTFSDVDNGIKIGGFMPAQPGDKPLAETGQVSEWANNLQDVGE